MTIVKQLISWLSLSLVVVSTNQVLAETTINTETYQPTFFAEYTPQTALDMVLRLPGFSFVETDNDIRGFAAGAGNVLIDGRRPTTKSGGITEALSRIPAVQVAHIEILRGAAGSADTAGQSVVANVVRTQQGTARRWSFALERANNGKLSPSTEWVLSEQIQGWDSAVKLNVTQQKSPRNATIYSYSADQEIRGFQQESRPSKLSEVFLSGDSKKQFINDQLSINARLGWSQFETDTKRISYADTAGQNGQKQFLNQRSSQYYAGELGVEWQQALPNGWQWRVLNINNAQNWFVDSFSQTQQPIDIEEGRLNLRFDEHKSEHVLRNLIRQSGHADEALQHQEYGVEFAYSQLESWLKLWDQEALLMPDLASQKNYSQAAELRNEFFANFSWQWQPLTLETGVAAEYSKLSVSGDNTDEQSLFFFKPTIAIIYNQNEVSQYRLSLRRSVGQLDFSDFAASADLLNDREFSGNPRLRPETKIKAALAFDHRFMEKGALSVEIYQEWRQHVLEQIVLPSGNHALGNAGNARVEGMITSLNLPLSNWISGAQLLLQANFVNSTFDDPVTGKSRQLTEISTPDISVDFRQDLRAKGLSWGVGYQADERSKEYFVDEINHYRTKGYWNVFIEGYLFDDLKVRFTAENLGDSQTHWQRWLYQTNRNSALVQRQVTERSSGPSYNLSISQVF